MKNIQLMLSSLTNKQAYIFIFLSLLAIVPAVENFTGNITNPFSSNALAIYTGSVFVLWVIPALAIRFISTKWGFIVFALFTTFWALGANSTKTNKDIQSSIAKSAGEIFSACQVNTHLQKNYCSEYKFSEDVTNICKTDISLLAPKDMQLELQKALESNTLKKNIEDLIRQIDQNIAQAKATNNFSNDALCAQIDKTTNNAYQKAIENIAMQKNK